MKERLETQVAALVLAAGRSQRFGSDKRLARLADGRAMLAAVCQLAGSTFRDVFVAVQPSDSADDLGLPANCNLLHCPDAAHGMGHTLANAMTRLPTANYRSVAVLLGDMPWIHPQTLQRLLKASTAEAIVFPVYQGQRGHPVLFGTRHWPALQQLHGDQGARRIIHAASQDCIAIEVNDSGVIRDADTPVALKQPN